MQITRATAAQPGYGMPPLDPSVLTDPAQGQNNLAWGLKYEAARAKAAGLDPSSPAGQAQLLGLYNGGGDPNYVQHVQGRMGAGQPTATSDIATDSAPAAPQSSAQQDPSAPPSTPSLAYTPPPLPEALQSRLNDTSGLFKSQRSRQLLAMAQGFLSGTGAGAGNFSAGLGRAAGNVLQEQDQDNATALDVYKTQMQQAQAAMMAQMYAGKLGIGQQNADTAGARAATAAAAQQEKQRYDGVLAGLKDRGLTIQQDLGTGKWVVAQENAETNRGKANNQAANLGATPLPSIPPGASLPGMGASGLGTMGPGGSSTPPAPPQGPAGGQPPAPPQGTPPVPPLPPQQQQAPQGLPPSLPGMGASGLTMMHPGGQMPPQGQQMGAQQGGPQPGLQLAPSGLPQMGPSGQPQRAAGGPSAPLPQSPTGQLQQPSQGPSTASSGAPAVPPTTPPTGLPAQLPGMGASGLTSNLFAPAGSIYDGLQGGLQARRQTQNRVEASNHKENEGDTSALEGFASADALADSQRALLAKVQAANPGITGTGLLAKVQQFIASNTSDPIVQEVQKNASQLTAANYPHGVGALRIPELKVAADQAAGMGQNILAGGHLLDQQSAQRAQMREVLQARQNFIAGHPQEDPTIAFDPVANAYLSQHPAYTEGPNGVIPGQPALAAFDQAHTNPQTGRFDPNYTAAVAGQKAFPSSTAQPGSDPEAAAAGARAFPPAASVSPVGAPAQTAADPLAAQIRTRLQDPAFRQRALQARGQAWVDHYSQ